MAKGYDVGKAFIQVVASFDQAQTDIARFVHGLKPIEIPAHIDPKGFSKDLDRAAQDAARKTTVDLGKAKIDVSDVNRGLAQAGKGVKVKIPAELDDAVAKAKAREFSAQRISLKAKVDADLTALRTHLKQLQESRPRIIVDIDLEKTRVAAEIKALEAKKAHLTLQVEADTRSANEQIEDLRAHHAAIVAKVDADISRAQAKLEKLENNPPKIGVDVELEKTKLETQIQALEARKALMRLQVQADIAGATAKINELTARNLALLAKVDADIAAAQAKLAELEAQKPHLQGQVDLDIAKAKAEITALEAKSIRIKAEIDDATALAELAALNGAVEHLNGKKVDVSVESASASRVIGIMGLLTAGIAAVGYAAPAAAAALAAIPAAIGVAGQGVSALLLAFSGVGDAVKAMQAADDESTAKNTSNTRRRESNANSIASAESSLESAQASADHTAISGAEQVASAREGLARAQESAARAQETAARAQESYARAQEAVALAQESSLRRTEDAERSLADAQKSARAAQAALTQERKDAVDRIKDLQLSLKGVALDEESAGIALEKAQIKLQKLKAAGVTGLDLREADVGARQAAQSLDEVRNRYSELQVQADYAAKTGVEGDRQVIAAHDAADAATIKVQDAERSLTETRADGARQVVQAQQEAAQAHQGVVRAQQEAAQAQKEIAKAGAAISQAQEHAAWANESATKAVADAQRNLAEASERAGIDGTTAMDKLHLAMSKLTPQGRAFATFLQREAKPALHEIGDAVQATLLPKMETAFRTLLQLSPDISSALRETSTVIGNLAIQGAKMVTSGPWRRDFQTIAHTNNLLLADLGQSTLSLADAFRNLLIAAGPMLLKFGAMLVSAAGKFAAFLEAKRATGELAQWFQAMGKRLQELWGFVTTVGRAIWDLASALSWMGGILIGLVKWLAELISGFTTAHPWITNILGVVGLLATAFVFLGRGIGGVIGAFTSARKGFKQLADRVDLLQGKLQGVADGTSRFAGVADAAAHPLSRLRKVAADLSDAYREGAASARLWAEAQLATTPAAPAAPKAPEAPGAPAAPALGPDLTGPQRALDNLRKSLRDVGTSAADMASRVSGAVSSAADSLLTKLGPTAVHMAERFDDLTNAAGRVGSALGGKIGAGLDALRNPGDLANRTMERLAVGIADTGAKLGSLLTPSLRESGTALDQGSGAASRMATSVRDHLSTAASAAGTAMRSLGDHVRSGFGSAVEAARSATDGLGARIKDGLGNAVSGAGDAVRAGLSRTAGVFESGLKGIAAVAGGTASLIGKGLTSAVAGLTEALGGPWMIAIIGATILLSIFADKQQEAAQKTADHKRDVDALTQAYTESKGKLDENVASTNNKALADKNAANNAKAAGSSFTIYAEAVNGNATAYDKVAKSADDALRAMASQAGLTGDQADALAAVGKTALQTGQNYEDLKGKVFDATAVFDNAGNRIDGLTKAQKDQVTAILNGVGAVGEQIQKNKEAQESYLLLAQAASKVSDATVKQWEASTKLRDITKELASASLALRDAQDQLHGSQRNVAKAQEDYNAALKEHKADSREVKDAEDALTGARSAEEHAILAVLDSAQRESEARNHALPELERQNKATVDRNKALLEMVKTYKGELPQALRDSVAGMSTADAVAAGFSVTINDLGQAIVKLPNGKTIPIDADPAKARTKLTTFLTFADGSKGTAKLILDTDPATGQTTLWQEQANGTIGQAKLQARINEATGATEVWVQQSDGTWAHSHLDAWIQPGTDKLVTWKDAADHTKGLALLDADTQPAKDALNDFQRWLKGYAAAIGLIIPGLIGPTPGNYQKPGGLLPLGSNAQGNLLEFYNGGGFRSLTKMSGSVARVVPPNTMRVVGDRADGDEAFIPVNRSPRSIEILNETAQRMGFGLVPLAAGGILGFADGAVAATGSPSTAAPAVPSVPMTPEQLAALTTAMAAMSDMATVLTVALTALQAASIAYTLTALAPLVDEVNAAVIPSLNALMALMPPVQGSFIATQNVVMAVMAGIVAATATAVAQIGVSLATLQFGLQVTGQAFASTSDWVRIAWGNIREYAAAPTRDVLFGPFNNGLISAWNYLDSSFALNHHLNPIAVPFAEGGRVAGPGTGTSDSVLTRLSAGEYVIPEWLTKRIFPFLEALRAGQAEALQATGYAGGGIVADTGSALNAAVVRGQLFARQQAGKPYIWGASGPVGYDCSGLLSAITNVLRGEANPYVRLGVSGSEPWPGFVHGLSSAWAMGGSPVHTAATLGGVNVESTGDHVRFGGDAHGADDPQFPIQSSLPVVGGKFISGGASFDPAALVAAAFTDTAAMIRDIRDRYPGNVMAGHGTGEASYASGILQKRAIDAIAATTVSGGPAVQAAQNFARSALGRFGWGQDQMAPLIALWEGESNWDFRKANPSSGAFGIPQALPPEKMASTGPDWRTNPATQILWGLQYIKDRPDYGSPAAAYAQWLSRSPHWYDDGGWLPPGYSTVANHTGKPEAILSRDQWNALTTVAGRQSAPGRTVTVYARTDASPEHIAHTVDRHLAIGARL